MLFRSLAYKPDQVHLYGYQGDCNSVPLIDVPSSNVIYLQQLSWSAVVSNSQYFKLATVTVDQTQGYCGFILRIASAETPLQSVIVSELTIQEKCSPGTYVSGVGSCSSCPIGKYSSTFETTACTTCSSSTYSNTTGATYCLNCPTGTSSASTNGQSCIGACAAGKYYVNGSTCISCPIGQYTAVNKIGRAHV